VYTFGHPQKSIHLKSGYRLAPTGGSLKNGKISYLLFFTGFFIDCVYYNTEGRFCQVVLSIFLYKNTAGAFALKTIKFGFGGISANGKNYFDNRRGRRPRRPGNVKYVHIPHQQITLNTFHQ